MEVRVTHAEFAEEMAWVSKVVPRRPANQALGCVHLAADSGRMVISANDGMISSVATLGVTSVVDGSVAVPGRLLAEVAKMLPREEVTLTEEKGGRLRVTSGKAEFKIPSIPVETYPSPPDQDGRRRGGDVS